MEKNESYLNNEIEKILEEGEKYIQYQKIHKKQMKNVTTYIRLKTGQK